MMIRFIVKIPLGDQAYNHRYGKYYLDNDHEYNGDGDDHDFVDDDDVDDDDDAVDDDGDYDDNDDDQ